MLFEIKNLINGEKVAEMEAETFCEAIEKLVKDGASLDCANLSRANLDGATLDGASLRYASLRYASLDGANLSRADLFRATLDGATLDGANLDGANLYRATLDGATLDGANLDGAKNFNPSHVFPQIQGTKHSIGMNGERIIRIGCMSYPIEWWLENNVRAGEENGYTPEQIAEYRRYIELIAEMYPSANNLGNAQESE
jgi:hypothetical protein